MFCILDLSRGNSEERKLALLGKRDVVGANQIIDTQNHALNETQICLCVEVAAALIMHPPLVVPVPVFRSGDRHVQSLRIKIIATCTNLSR